VNDLGRILELEADVMWLKRKGKRDFRLEAFPELAGEIAIVEGVAVPDETKHFVGTGLPGFLTRTLPGSKGEKCRNQEEGFHERRVSVVNSDQQTIRYNQSTSAKAGIYHRIQRRRINHEKPQTRPARFSRYVRSVSEADGVSSDTGFIKVQTKK
jgi:hypothetical protein